MARLPLFPLRTVLMPGAGLPLRIFEPRYVELLRTLLDGRDTPRFGVVAVAAGSEVGDEAVPDVYDIGCAAVLQHVEALGDGGYHVVARGTERFRLDAVVDGPEPYHVGEVTWLADGDGDPARAAALARTVRPRLLEYRFLIGASDDDLAHEAGADTRPLDARHLSFRLADLVVLPLADRQALLACPDTVSRLDLGRRLLRREQVLVEHLRALPQDPEAPPPSYN